MPAWLPCQWSARIQWQLRALHSADIVTLHANWPEHNLGIELKSVYFRMQPYFRLLIPLLLTAFLWSCNKETMINQHVVKTVTTDADRIKGEWEWVHSIGGGWGEQMTPASLGITKTLIIDDSIYTEIINDSITLQVPYEFRYDTTISTNPGLIDIGVYPVMFVRFYEGLILQEYCLHCYLHYYTRK
jgi:hypothetical protein